MASFTSVLSFLTVIYVHGCIHMCVLQRERENEKEGALQGRNAENKS